MQDSELGPTLYIVLKGDLKPISSINVIFKYADDTNLLVPEFTDVQLRDEYETILNRVIFFEVFLYRNSYERV